MGFALGCEMVGAQGRAPLLSWSDTKPGRASEKPLHFAAPASRAAHPLRRRIER